MKCTPFAAWAALGIHLPHVNIKDENESSQSDSHSIREDNSQSDNSSEDSDVEAEKRFDDQESSHRGSDSSGDLSEQVRNTFGDSPPWSDEDGTPIIILCYAQTQSIKGHDNFMLISNNILDDIQTDW